MSDTYTKLFSSIAESTVWGEPYPTRIVWVTMLAMADSKGNVYGAVPGLARRANVTLEEAEAALAAFLAPDPYSRSQEQDGRRIEVIEGGWRLVNHAKYRAMRDEDERRAYKRDWDRRNRSKAARADAEPDNSDQGPTDSDKSDQSDPTNTITNTREEPPHTPPPTEPPPTPKKRAAKKARPAVGAEVYPPGFVRFWDAYPAGKRSKKVEAAAVWKRDELEDYADTIVRDVQDRKSRHWGWIKDGGAFIPGAQVYLNGRRWNDDIEPQPRGSGRRSALEAANTERAERWAGEP